MAGRLASWLDRFAGCYTITGSVSQSMRFAGRNTGKGHIKLSVDSNTVMLRRKEADKDVFITTFLQQFHRCPFHLGEKPVIVDLGSNIGLTVIDFKRQYPDARIIAVELDRENYELSLENTAQLENCTIMHAAVWMKDGQAAYSGKDEQSYAVLPVPEAKGIAVRAISMDTLLNENKPDKIDYLKMDIEGAEYDILSEASPKEWLKKVKYLSIEVHNTTAVKNEDGILKLVNELENNNFLAWRSAIHWSSVFAVNKSFSPNDI